MGAGNFDVAAYKVQAEQATVKENSGFTATAMCDEFNPSGVKMRQSKRGPFNEFRDVITVLIGLDVTGSMDIIPKSLLQGKLGSLMVDLKKTFAKPNENLQISFAGIGDAKSDKAPLQVTHFESDNRFAQQLEKIYLEGGGGANGAESYNLLWWYAANKTQLNYVRQERRKGILITIGDDNVHPDLTANEIQMWLDPKYDGGDLSNQVLLYAAQEQYDVYHIVITDGHAYGYDYRTREDKTEHQKISEANQWKALLGDNNVVFSKSGSVADAIAEIIKRHRPLQKAHMINLSDKEWEHQNKENLTDNQWVEVLHYTLCPLTRQFMSRPVEWNRSKNVCEKEAVEDYVRDHELDPILRTKLLFADLACKPNYNIAQLCLQYKPYFDALPEDRRKHLVQLTLPAPAQVVFQKADDSVKGQLGFFGHNEPEQAMVKLENVQLSLECPITKEIMRDPVMLLQTRQSYERDALVKWLSKSNTDPATGLQLISQEFVENFALKGACDQARDVVKPK